MARDIGRTLTPAEEAAHRAKIDAARREREAEEKRLHGEAAVNAMTIWNQSTPAPENHPYL
jgi:putative DNA primase/helicase